MMSSRVRPQLLATALLTLACSGSPGEPPPVLSDEGSALLVLRGTITGTADIFAIPRDGSPERRLTSDAYADHSAHLSRDGQRIVFVSAREIPPGRSDPRSDIYVMNADGSGQRLLSAGAGPSNAARWSPDGTRIVFHRYDPAVQRFRVYVMNADGSGVRALTSGATENFSPEWSPNGRRILYLSNRPPRVLWTMYVMNADGTGERQLSGDAVCANHVHAARWSPDGSRIAYACGISSSASIYVMNADGTGAETLYATTLPGATATDPVWSPSGRQIAFTLTPFSSSSSVWVIDAAGGTPALLDLPQSNHSADWGPGAP